jgi:hypothetical protein
MRMIWRLGSWCINTQENTEMEGNAWRWTDRCRWGFIAVDWIAFSVGSASVKPLFGTIEGAMGGFEDGTQSDTTDGRQKTVIDKEIEELVVKEKRLDRGTKGD